MNELLTTIQGWIDPETLATMLIQWGGRLVAALLIFMVGRWIAAALTRWFARTAGRTGVDDTLIRFLRNVIYATLLVVVALAAADALGVDITSFVVILGAAGLAVGLALKDSLGNFSSGVMLVCFRPFKSGDYVEAAGIAGTVEDIGIFNTVLKTPDNRVITIPNGLIYGDTITNYSAESTRRVDLVIGIGYDDDPAEAKRLIGDILDADERVLDEPAPTLMLLELADSSVNIAVRPWVASADYWAVRGDLLERVKTTLEANGLTIPYPQRDVHLIGQVATGS